ncbi:translation initiation factor IF-2 N-terminal domain-containing protein [Corynebacterium sp. CCUG 71335]|uniref:translation initiation factor IF-2 N-terminal domain-containing protein n=1 Tax=unclassified Corynebacterium TaxID=2624378 RepID=UPI00210D5CD9|nr:translation initiation factor IF-2 N-terminal domain-containing protein [Corynebacterium sp. CCUG 71335]MCQ4623205.1 translation initiation factor IF-2 N-terminal domain-containing protein [Corynebacterium sp. CCUG 70398]
MADSDENTTTEVSSAAPAQKKTTKKSAVKSTKKTAKKSTKTARKTAKKSSRRAAKKSTSSSEQHNETQAAEQSATPLYDRSRLGEKTRVFALAKELGMSSKDLVVALNELGMVKVAQSSLTRAETEQLLDALESQPSSSDDKIRERVRKDVAHEINQIEEKVEADLESAGVAEPADEDSDDTDETDDAEVLYDVEPDVTPAPEDDDEDSATGLYAPVFKAAPRSSRRRASRSSESDAKGTEQTQDAPGDAADAGSSEASEDSEDSGSKSKRRSSRKTSRKRTEKQDNAEPEQIDEPKAIKGSSRLEAQRRRRTERREEDRNRSRVVSQAEFLARRESVERTMVVRERSRHDGPGKITEVGVLEDGLLVEHFVDSDDSASMIGNIYLGRVQNVLPSMEAAFIDIGQGRNGVLYAGEVDWKAAGLGGRARRIEQALKSGDQVLVQVTKDPVGHKGARLTTQISLAGRYLVYVPGGHSAGISRKLPAPERKRLKDILVKVVPGKGGAIIRTAAEGVPEEAIAADVKRLHTQWQTIRQQSEQEKKSKGSKPVTLYEEPRLLVKVVRDLFNEDFQKLVVDGKKPWNVVSNYVESVAPDLADRLELFDRGDHDGQDVFEVYRVDEQIQKALSRTVWLPSGGTLVIDRTEAMTVIDVNTGKFTGSGGSLEETVTSNNMEAAEEIVRQLRLRDIGGMIIIDFIDMILPENQELVLRRFKEALGRDRTRHQVSEVTSLGLVQLTRKRLGTGLVETFSTKCECCDGRGIVLSDDPVRATDSRDDTPGRGGRRGNQSRRRKPAQDPAGHPAALAMQGRDDDPSQESGRDTENDVEKDVEQLEELADAVVITNDPVEPIDTSDTSDTDDSSDEDRPKRRSSRRRGRRGSGRGKGRPQQETTDTQDTPEDSSGRDDEDASEPAKTYEEAVEEFERSPRRKRNTRGNSTSDHRPRREDYEQAEAEDDQPDDSAESAQPRTSDPGRAPERGSRGRRRATRRTTAGRDTARQPVNEKPMQRQDPAKKSSGKAAPQQSDQPAQTRSRGRRRATRRTS